MNFEKEKRDILNRSDKSKKGSIDKAIVRLVNLFNSSPNYYTTSSCSGRILILKKPESNKKCDVNFVFESHNPITKEEIKISLNNIPHEELWFKQESFIIHICCKTLEDAKRLLAASAKAGLKHSGIVSLRKNLVEIVCNESINTLISKEGRIYITEEYLDLLVKEANKKLIDNYNRLERFYKIVKEEIIR